MKAFILGKFAFVWMPALDFEQGVYEYQVFPTLIYTNDKGRQFKSLTVHWLRWAFISVIKTV
ncbi:hypothetical protein LCGC14_2750590 [marine sediment metagenome]|uniref:Uncharacterized protein n=1 Tax=marine sediment metagenome TaxID=412755 RepID=A0A0F8ZNX9_9ZZZZ